MFYLIAKWLEFEGIFNLFRYQTFRTGAAILTALFIGLLIVFLVLKWLKRKKI